MQDLSEALHLEHDHHATHAWKFGVPTFIRTVLKAVLLSFAGLAILVAMSSAVWWATWRADVQFKLGTLYEDGSQLTPKNYTQAFHWYSQAAAKGDIKAQLKLAEMYSKGAGIPSNLGAAFTLYRTLADKGNALAQYQLGEMYLSGRAVAQNIESGMTLLEKSAHQDNAEAAYKLGTIYAKGFGGDADEQNMLSDHDVVYNNMNEGVSQSFTRSAAWYLKAATLGHAEAQSALGMLYFEGKGVQRNNDIAYVLESIAATRGSVKASILSSQVVATLTQDQIIAAQPFIDGWLVGQSVIFVE